MRNSTVSTCALAAVIAMGAPYTSAQESTPPSGCSVAFDSTSLDAQSGRGVFRRVRLRCEDVNIEADEATASELVPQKGDWQFRGNIRIGIESAVVTADTATFRFADNDLVFGELAGSPAVLEDFIPEENNAVRATAGRIYYDNVERIARMEQGASLVLGTSEMSGCGDIIYDLDRGLVDSISNCGEPFVIKLRPRPEESSPNEAPITR